MSWWVLVPGDAAAAPDRTAWPAAARRFFGIELHDRGAAIAVSRVGVPGEVELPVAVDPVARVPEVVAAAREAAGARGGGFDALVARARWVWTIDAAAEEPGAIALAATIALVGPGPILDPAGSEIFGVKGARERLARLGWTAGPPTRLA